MSIYASARAGTMAEDELGRKSTRPFAQQRSMVYLIVATLALVAGSVGLIVAGTTGAATAKPTIVASPTTTSPGQYVQFSGANWVPNNAVYLYLDGTYFCGITSNASGVLPTTACQIPEVPDGTQTVFAEMKNNAQTATTTLTITPSITDPTAPTAVSATAGADQATVRFVPPSSDGEGPDHHLYREHGRQLHAGQRRPDRPGRFQPDHGNRTHQR